MELHKVTFGSVTKHNSREIQAKVNSITRKKYKENMEQTEV